MQEIEIMYERLRGGIQQAPVELKELHEQGKPVVGIYCAYTPVEVIMAAGAIPVSLCSTSGAPIAAAEEFLPRNLCPLIKASYGFAITDKCPYFHFSDLVVGETTCDGKKKMYEYLNRIRPTHVMQLPQTLDRPDSLPLWEKELRLLGSVLEERFGTQVTEKRLSEALRIKNREHRALNDIFTLAAQNPPLMTGLETLLVSDFSRVCFDKERSVREITAVRDQLVAHATKGWRRMEPGRPRILVTGCPLGKALEKVIVAIEEAGGAVVCYENCGNFKSTRELVDETQPPFSALAAKYLRTPCSCLSPNDGRMDLLRDLAGEFRVDGVVEVILQACHTYAVESLRVRELARQELEMPYIAIETDYSPSDAEQIATRIGAFVEML